MMRKILTDDIMWYHFVYKVQKHKIKHYFKSVFTYVTKLRKKTHGNEKVKIQGCLYYERWVEAKKSNLIGKAKVIFLLLSLVMGTQIFKNYCFQYFTYVVTIPV